MCEFSYLVFQSTFDYCTSIISKNANFYVLEEAINLLRQIKVKRTK